MTLYTGRLNLYTDVVTMFKRLAFLLLISFSLSGCVLDGDGPSKTTNASHRVPDNLVEGDIYVSINFQQFPDTILVNHALTDNLHTEFYVFIEFDVNGNGIEDEGDISFELIHVKSNDDEPKKINTNELEAYSSIVTEVISETSISTTELTKLSYSVENNNVAFSINKSSHDALLNLTSSTRVKISASYIDANDEFQWDSFPENGYTPEGIDLTNMLDNSDDVYSTSSEPIIVDIQEISIQFIE